MSEADRIVRFLGGKKALHTSPSTAIDFVRIIRRGIPYRSFAQATLSLDLSVAALSRALGLNWRTMTRRRHTRWLTPAESERMLRLARVVVRAEEVLGDEAAARGWLRDPNGGLGGEAPMNLLDTDVGAETVFNILGRIEHGLVS